MRAILNKIKKIPVGFKAAGVYTLASVFSKGLSVITVPIFTRIMSSTEIGVVNLYNSWQSMLSVVVTLSLTSGGYTAALREFRNERDQYQSSVLSLTSLMALLTAAIYMIRPSFWNGLTGLPVSLSVLLLVVFFLMPAYDFWLARQRYEYKYRLAAGLTAGMALLASAAAVAVVLYMDAHQQEQVAVGRLYASNTISYLVAGTLWAILILRGKTFYHKAYWKYSLQLSIPLIGYALANQVLNVSDRMMISHMVNNSAVGIYGTLYTVSSLSLMVWGAINSSFIPYLYENIEKKNTGVKKYSQMLMGSYAIIAVLLTFVAPEIVRILATEEYYEAIYIMPPIAGGVFLTCVSNMYSNVLIYYKKTPTIMVSAITAAVVNVVLNFIFIARYGYMAAAYTTLVAYIVLAVMQMLGARKVCREKRGDDYEVYDDKAVAVMAAVTIALSLGGLLLYGHTVLRYAVIALGCVLGAAFVYKTWKMKKAI